MHMPRLRKTTQRTEDDAAFQPRTEHFNIHSTSLAGYKLRADIGDNTSHRMPSFRKNR